MQPTKFDLTGKTAIVTGAGRGIGRACATALAANGADVVVTSRSQDQINETLALVKETGRNGLAITADITKRDQIDAVVDNTIETFGGVDILVNNAGIFTMKPLVRDPDWRSGYADFVPGFDSDFTDEDWYAQIDTNVTSIMRFCQAVGPHMMKKKKGKIVNIGSIDAEHGLKFAAAYCATKGAVKSFTQGLALEWVRYNINVNCVSPGYTVTGLADWVYGDEERMQVAAKNNVPMRRFGTPEEMATPVVYLASDLSDYVTGQSIYVDGGVLA